MSLTIGIVCCIGGSINPLRVIGQIPQQSEPEKAEPKLESLGAFKNKEINESSGLAFAAVKGYENAFWTINDSGNKPIIYLVKPDGTSVGQMKLLDVRNKDWEAMCRCDSEDEPMLVVADVGDNSFNRKSYELIFVPEPQAIAGSLEVKPTATHKFKFEDKSLNCEAIGFDSKSQSFFFVEKIYIDAAKSKNPGVYTLPLADLKNGLKENEPLSIAKRIGDLPVRNVTGMAFSPDTRRLIIRTYFLAFLFERPKDKDWAEVIAKTKPSKVPLPIQSQGEAICFADDSNSLFVTSERANSTVWKIELPPIDAEEASEKK